MIEYLSYGSSGVRDTVTGWGSDGKYNRDLSTVIKQFTEPTVHLCIPQPWSSAPPLLWSSVPIVSGNLTPIRSQRTIGCLCSALLLRLPQETSVVITCCYVCYDTLLWPSLFTENTTWSCFPALFLRLLHVTVVVLHCSCDCLDTLLLYSSLNTDAPTRWFFQLIRLPTTRLCCFYICSDQPSLLTKRNSPLPSRSIRTKRYCDINCFSCCVIWLF